MASWSNLWLPCSWTRKHADGAVGTAVVSDDYSTSDLLRRLRSCTLMQAKRVTDRGPDYKLGAHVPNEEWKAFNETKAIGQRWLPRSYGEFVALKRLSNPILKRLRPLLRDIEQEQSCEELVQIVRDALMPTFECASEYVVNGLARSEQDLQTVTINRETQRRIGMHLDSWERAKFEERRFARNRISINVGASPRWLLFMTTPIETAFHQLGIQYDAGRPIVEQAFSSAMHARLIVYGLCVEPGDAYIAPTETLVHDATTRGTSTEDRTISVRIGIRPREYEANASIVVV